MKNEGPRTGNGTPKLKIEVAMLGNEVVIQDTEGAALEMVSTTTENQFAKLVNNGGSL